MIDIDDILISSEVLEKRFVCDLFACKGECCVQGDSGAPLEKEEIAHLREIFPIIKNYLSQKNIIAIETQGIFIQDAQDGEFVTPLVNNKECAYVYFDENKIAKCAIEKAYFDKKVSFRKPISCHLYPIRVSNYNNFQAVNYHNWPICKPACECGSKHNIKTYQFLKEPLIRKFGKSWFEKLEEADRLREKK